MSEKIVINTTVPPPKVDLPPPFAAPPPNVLKVQEAYTRDLYKGIARIDYNTMDAAGVSTGDVIAIQSVDLAGVAITDKRWTVAKVLPLYPSDEDKKLIRLDGIIRDNAQVGLGDLVSISKVSAPPLLSVKVRLEKDQVIPENIRVMFESLSLTVGDDIRSPHFSGMVIELNPGPVGKIARTTTFEIVEPHKDKKVSMVCFEQEEAKINARILEGWKPSQWLVATSWSDRTSLVPTAVMERVVLIEGEAKAEDAKAEKGLD